jgi:hypothetical protein
MAEIMPDYQMLQTDTGYVPGYDTGCFSIGKALYGVIYRVINKCDGNSAKLAPVKTHIFCDKYL